MLRTTEKLTEWENGAVISFLLSVLTDEQRNELKHALPSAYNKLAGCNLLRIEHTRLDPLVSAVEKKSAA